METTFYNEEQSELETKKFTSQYDLERWYEKLKEETFYTRFILLSEEEATSLCDAYQQRGNIALLPSQQQQLLKTLEQKITKELKTYEFKSGAFVRLSTRSPKDSVLIVPRIKRFISEEMKKIEEGDENRDTIEWYCAVIKSMKVLSGQEALEMLVNSNRTYQDLSRVLKFPDEFQVYIILRQWHFIHPSHEFRAFIYDLKLNAVSQYIDCCFFPELVEKKDKLAMELKKYFESIKEKLPMKNSVLDLALLDTGEWKLIEINPFFEKTGPALFNWKADKELLQKGDANSALGFEFRIIPDLASRKMQGFTNPRELLLQEPKEKPKKGDHKCQMQ